MKPYRRLLRRLLPPSLLNRLNAISHLEDRLCELEVRCARIAAAAVFPRFPGLVEEAAPHEFGIFSQNGEDGILLWLLQQTGAPRKSFAEIGVENGRECNTAVLGLVLGWSGVMFEEDPLGAAAARRLAARALKDRQDRIEVRQLRVTRENADALLGDGELGVLSIDVDGADYWLWEAARRVRPRIVIVEYNASFGPDRRITVPYQAGFSALAHHPSGYYHGASLAALEALGRNKGYSLVSVCSAGVNAFFLRDDILPPTIPARAAAEIFRPHAVRSRVHTPEEQWNMIRHLPYESV